jgi:hypothetical protein
LLTPAKAFGGCDLLETLPGRFQFLVRFLHLAIDSPNFRCSFFILTLVHLNRRGAGRWSFVQCQVFGLDFCQLKFTFENIAGKLKVAIRQASLES